MFPSKSQAPFTRKQLAIIFKIAFLEAMALSVILPSAQSTGEVTIQNSCIGLLLQYGRCEQNLSGQSVTIPALGTINFQVNFTTPYIHAPFVLVQPTSGTFTGVGQSNDVLLSDNGTRTSGTCIGCATFVFPTANTIGLVPSGTGYLSIHGGFDFLTGQYPSIPTQATLNINVVSISNLTSNGRNLWIQGFDPDVHGDGTCIGQWEVLGTVGTQRPGLANNGLSPIFNWGVGFFHGDRGSFGGVIDTGVPTAINQTIITDSANSYPTCQTNGDVMLRVVGSLTSGHETITYSQLYITFYYGIITGDISLVGISTTFFIVDITGSPGTVVTFIWKAISESG